MDSPERNFLALIALASSLGGYALCGFLAFVLLPAARDDAPGVASPLCLLPALALGGLLATSVWRGAASVHAHLASSLELSRRVDAAALPQPPRLRAAAEASDLGGRVTLVDDGATFSFAHGMLAVRVAVSRGLFQRLGEQELLAVLEHERYHVCSLDPLRGLIASAVAESFFLFPVMQVLRDRYEASRELAADAAAERAGGRRPLLTALLAALADPRDLEAVSPSLAAPGSLEARVSRLETGRAPRLATPDRATAAWSAYGAAIFACVFALAIVGLGGSGALAAALAAEADGGSTVACLAPALAFVALTRWYTRRAARRRLGG